VYFPFVFLFVNKKGVFVQRILFFLQTQSFY